MDLTKQVGWCSGVHYAALIHERANEQRFTIEDLYPTLVVAGRVFRTLPSALAIAEVRFRLTQAGTAAGDSIHGGPELAGLQHGAFSVASDQKEAGKRAARDGRFPAADHLEYGGDGVRVHRRPWVFAGDSGHFGGEWVQSRCAEEVKR